MTVKVAKVTAPKEFSIHPRNWKDSVADHKKRNTCKPCKDTSRGKLGRKQKRLNMRRNAHSLTVKTVHANQIGAYKTPGSMK